MGNLIEYVAEAISDSLEKELPPRLQQTWSDLSSPAKVAYRIRAVAAINAVIDHLGGIDGASEARGNLIREVDGE